MPSTINTSHFNELKNNLVNISGIQSVPSPQRKSSIKPAMLAKLDENAELDEKANTLKNKLYAYAEVIEWEHIKNTFMVENGTPLPKPTIKAGKALCYAL